MSIDEIWGISSFSEVSDANSKIRRWEQDLKLRQLRCFRFLWFYKQTQTLCDWEVTGQCRS